MVQRRPTDDLLPEVLGKVYWTEGLGYRLDVELKDGTTKVFDVEFINDNWYLLEETEEGFKTNASGKIRENELGTGYWLSAHPKNPKNLVLAVAPSFGHFLAQGTSTMTQNQPNPTTEINMGGGPVAETNEPDTSGEHGNGSLKGKAPEVFNGDRTKSKAFMSELKIYFTLNRNKTDVKNCYSRTLIALSFIKGPNIVNWVDTQFDVVKQQLRHLCGKDEYDDLLWEEFENRFKKAFVSSTIKESAIVKMENLKMKGDQLDEYIAEHTTLISELEWEHDSEISCQTFRKGLPPPLAKRVIEMEGMPSSLTMWIKQTQKHHARWAMSKALGYQAKREQLGKKFSKWNSKETYREKKKERDPDAMDVDFTQMHPDKKERLMKSGSCFQCEKQGHLSRECPNKNKASIREATVEPPKQSKGKEKALPKAPTEPPSYESLLKGINACTMEDRQKLLEVFSNAGDSNNEDF